MELWNRLTMWQKFGLAFVGAVIVLAVIVTAAGG